jgi:hypothetical protein
LRKKTVGKRYAELGVPQEYDDQGNPVYLEDAEYKQLGDAYGNKQGFKAIRTQQMDKILILEL